MAAQASMSFRFGLVDSVFSKRCSPAFESVIPCSANFSLISAGLMRDNSRECAKRLEMEAGLSFMLGL